MSPKIKYGLILGGIALVLNVFVSAAFGICGPVVSAVAGALAGYFAAKNEHPISQGEGAKVGAVAGAISGALAVIGQVIGGIGALTIVPMLWKVAQSPLSSITGQTSYWATGLAISLCFGVVGIGLSAGTGAGTGYISTHPTVPSPTSSLPNQ